MGAAEQLLTNIKHNIQAKHNCRLDKGYKVPKYTHRQSIHNIRFNGI